MRFREGLHLAPLPQADSGSQVVRRRGKTDVINGKNRRMKAR
ncbi:50S ribosomal protein L36 [Streptomyces sp. tea 10]|nr:50S ribosomal protein L36 [Streptomyces sp. tea 10]